MRHTETDEEIMNNKLLMAHQVAGYPDNETALTAAEALIAGGTGILEVQLAFSDPSADGPAIQTACSSVLAKGYTVKDGLNYIAEIKKRHPEIPVFIMTYGSLVYRPGVENFVKQAHDAGVSGLIVPDLPFDCDEGLTAACKKYGMHNIPVAAPSMTEERLHKMATAGFKYIYTALRAGITGSRTVITDEMLSFIDKAAEGGSTILGGFGISTGEQSALLAPHVTGVIAGSVFVNLITNNYDPANLEESRKKIFEDIKAKAEELTAPLK